jgi:hypothetical protein
MLIAINKSSLVFENDQWFGYSLREKGVGVYYLTSDAQRAPFVVDYLCRGKAGG